MTSRKINLAPPDRANELFDRLLATSDGALKTRERLFAELKEELELLASLQEQHLFPVLQRHGMQSLMREAIDDNQETNTLLAQLESMPKNNSEFLPQLIELRKVFQQHLRDDRKELLPAVLKVLTDEEAEAVVEKVEDDMAAIDEMKRNESKRSPNQFEAVQRVADDMSNTMRATAEGVQAVARTLQEAVENGLGAVSELARRSSGQALDTLRRPEEATEQASQNFRTVAQSGAALARGIENVTRECFELSQKRWQTNLDGLSQLARCRSLADLVAVQSSLIRDNLEQTLNNGRRMAELTVQMTDEATRTVTVQAEKTAQHMSRAA